MYFIYNVLVKALCHCTTLTKTTAAEVNIHTSCTGCTKCMERQSSLNILRNTKMKAIDLFGGSE